MSTRATGSKEYLALRPSMTMRLREAAARSMVVRTLLLGVLAIGVTVGGVAAGALVVAPIVGKTTNASTTATATSKAAGDFSALAANLKRQAIRGWQQLDEQTGVVLARMPEPVGRYGLPTVAVVAITGALLALFLPARGARLATVTASSAAVRNTAPRGLTAIAPRGTRSVTGRKQTPDAVEALAASGASAPDIAWRTGLSLDAVRLLLAISTGNRQLQPPAA